MNAVDREQFKVINAPDGGGDVWFFTHSYGAIKQKALKLPNVLI